MPFCRFDPSSRAIFCSVALVCLLALPAWSAEPRFRFLPHVVNPEGGVGMAVAVVDVNGDKKPDIIGVSEKDVVWYENPAWRRHLICNQVKGNNVCVAPQDLDGDGLPELALGADWQFTNTSSGGSLHVLHRGADVNEPWQIFDLATEPSLHRIRWADLDGDGKPELIVAPLKGRNTAEPYFKESGVRLMRFMPPEDRKQLWTAPWPMEVIDDTMHVLHNICPYRPDPTLKRELLLTASFEGITQVRRGLQGGWKKLLLVTGNPEPCPNCGAGEIRFGLYSPMERLLGTIEPWHGNQAVVYYRRMFEQKKPVPKEEAKSEKPGGADKAKKPKANPPEPEPEGTPWARFVVDNQIAGGHAVAFADFDGDHHDDMLVGFRDKAGPKQLPGLNIYSFHVDKKGNITSEKFVVDDGGMAAEDATAADVNGDGRPDIVAIGPATHNLMYYENLGPKK